MTKTQYLQEISSLFAILSEKVRILNRNSEYSINIQAENIYAKVLSEIFDCRLENVNYQKSNFPSIDLIDKKNKLAFQITSTATHSKIIQTLKKFISNKLYYQFHNLYVFNIKKKGDSKTYKQSDYDDLARGFIKFDCRVNIIDSSDLYLMLNAENNTEKIRVVYNILKEEIPNLSTVSVSLKSISLSFDEKDTDLAFLITRGLIDRGINVFTSSLLLDEHIKREFGNNEFFHKMTASNFPLHIEYCGVIITDKYINARHENNCQVLKRSIAKDDRIICFQFSEKVNRSYVLKISKVIYPIINNNYQKVIDTITYRLERSVPKFNSYRYLEEVLASYDDKSAFEKIASYSDSIKKIGYELFKSQDKILRIDIFWLYLYSGIAQKKTYELVKSNHSEIFGDRLIILLPKERGQIHVETRKKNINDLFKPSNIFYLDDFIWENRVNAYDDNNGAKFLIINNFIDPYLKDAEGHVHSTEVIENWIEYDDTPILVLKGGGGTGKTTMARRASDLYRDIRPNSKVIFIESNKIIDELRRRTEDEEIDLYTFYEVDCNRNNDGVNNKLDQTLFKINVDNGNILIIIDGLDEVFAKLPSFEALDLLESIYSYTNEIGRGKVLITCRDYFWNENNMSYTRNIETFELVPFDKLLAKKFFEKNHPNNVSLVNKCMRIAGNFSPVKEEKKAEFIPYVLDVVDSIAQEEDGYKLDEGFNSIFLNEKLKNDYIVYRVCLREKRRLGQIIPDNQILLFKEFAIKYNGIIKEEKIYNLFDDHDLIVSENTIKAFKAHPFLKVGSGYIYYRYDFLNDYFKGIYLSRLIDIDNEIPIDPNIIKILADDCKYHSGLLQEIASRVTMISEEIVVKISDLVLQVHGSRTNTMITERTKKKAISGLFNIALKINHSSNRASIDDNTILLKDIFGGGGNMISTLSLDGIIHNDPIIFDFSNLVFHDAYIKNFSNFFLCKFNVNTFFDKSCQLLEIADRYLDFSETTATAANFHNRIRTDGGVQRVLEKKQFAKKVLQQDIIDEMETFFNIFDSNGMLSPKKIEDVKKKYKRRKFKIVAYRDMFKTLERLSIVETYRKGGRVEYIAIRKENKADIQKFLKEGTPSKTTKNILNNILQSF